MQTYALLSILALIGLIGCADPYYLAPIDGAYDPNDGSGDFSVEPVVPDGHVQPA